MAINITTDIALTTGGKLSDITAIQGGWQTFPSASNMNALTGSAILKGKLSDGQIFYIESTNELYKLNITGTFPLVNYNFEEFAWPGGGAGGNVAALNTFSGSIQSEVNSLKTFSGSIQSEVDSLKAVTSSYALKTGNTFTGTQNIDGNLNVTGDIVAERYIVSSSVTHLTQSFSSGSTIFGDSIDDTHLFTGSLSVTGSFFLNNRNISDAVGRIFKQTGSFFSTTNDVRITGSTFIELNGTDTFDVRIQGEKKFSVNAEGVVMLGAFTSAPTPVAGGMFYSSSNDFYLGI